MSRMALCGGVGGPFFSVYGVVDPRAVKPIYPRQLQPTTATTAAAAPPKSTGARSGGEIVDDMANSTTASTGQDGANSTSTIPVFVIIIIVFGAIALVAVGCGTLLAYIKRYFFERLSLLSDRHDEAGAMVVEESEHQLEEHHTITRLHLISATQLKSFATRSETFTESNSTLVRSGFSRHEEVFLAELQQEYKLFSLPRQHPPLASLASNNNPSQPIYIHHSTALGVMSPQLQQSFETDNGMYGEIGGGGRAPSASSDGSFTTHRHGVYRSSKVSEHRDSSLLDIPVRRVQSVGEGGGGGGGGGGGYDGSSSLYMDVLAGNQVFESQVTSV
ncbi:hypothetical protein HDU81_009690 [Chytriomyces hyalinus]|nr:hypothetical protein HDU81_009690 [Chytriomyces hyalinus]